MKKLNVLLSDLAVFNTKLHNIHWNVVGLQFVSIHKFTEALYDEVFATFDEVGEIIKMKGEFPVASLKAHLENASISELGNAKISVQESIKLVLEDLKHINKSALDIRSEMEETFEVSNLMEDIVEKNNVHIWFLESMLEKK